MYSRVGRRVGVHEWRWRDEDGHLQVAYDTANGKWEYNECIKFFLEHTMPGMHIHQLMQSWQLQSVSILTVLQEG